MERKQLSNFWPNSDQISLMHIFIDISDKVRKWIFPVYDYSKMAAKMIALNDIFPCSDRIL